MGYLTIIPRAGMGMAYDLWPVTCAHEGERDNCFSKIQLVVLLELIYLIIHSPRTRLED